MKNNYEALNKLGWSDWFAQRAICEPTDAIARVAAVDRDQLLIEGQAGQFRAKLSGSYLHHHVPEQFPCVGDWVCVERQHGDDFGIIHAVIERRTSLHRKSAGHNVEHQMIAANIDYVVIVQSCQFDFNLNRLQRYLVMILEGGAAPCILLTKTDLVDPGVLSSQLAEIASAGITAPIFPLSNVTRHGLDEFRHLLVPTKTYCFVGSSGVGKSTLINHLIGHQQLETGSTSGTGEGRHTTVRRELIRLEGGALVIDNPGMRELGIIDANEGIGDSYADISALSTGCHYRNCSHTDEPGCAVLAAVRDGEISTESLGNFHKIKEESRFNDMSYADKRKKDRNFGRYIKSAKKDLKKDK
ncbi:MAG: ribosome small subunit-dependent GTPase A [Gammaproteobacteria bacterium]|nr:ribosome small subunit-dependent GTPase A [Gammaproteobacteria bacterium]